MVAPKRKIRPLSPREIQFAENLLSGMNQTEALQAAAPDLAKRWKITSLHVKASIMSRDPRIQEYLKTELELRAQLRRTKDHDLLTRVEKRALFAKVARGNLIDWPIRLRAAQLDNAMTGDLVLRVEQELTLGTILKNLTPTTGILSEEPRLVFSPRKISHPVDPVTADASSTPAVVATAGQRPPGPLDAPPRTRTYQE